MTNINGINCTEVNKIYSTMEYDKFKYQIGNREIMENNVKDIIKKIEKNEYDTAFPIVVNKNMEIIDGQHRFEALKRLGLPIIFCFSSNEGTLEETIDINNTRRNWKQDNYIHTQIAKGNLHYILFQQLIEENNYDKYIVLGFLIGRPTNGTDMNKVKQGELQITNIMIDSFNTINNEFQQLSNCIKCKKEKTAFNKRDFAHAYLDIRRSPNFKFKRMMNVMKKDEGSFISTEKGAGGFNNRHRALLALYNKGLNEDNRL